MTKLIFFLFIFMIGCMPKTHKTELMDGIYYYSYGDCHGLPDKVIVENGVPNYNPIVFNIDYNLIYIECGSGKNLYIWEGNY